MKVERIVTNKLQCHKCADIIESKHGHNFVSCSCGNIAVDGGKNYLRRVGNGISDRSYTDMSETYEVEIETEYEKYLAGKPSEFDSTLGRIKNDHT